MTAPVRTPTVRQPLPRLTITFGAGGAILLHADSSLLSVADIAPEQRQAIVNAVADRLGVVR